MGIELLTIEPLEDVVQGQLTNLYHRSQNETIHPSHFCYVMSDWLDLYLFDLKTSPNGFVVNTL